MAALLHDEFLHGRDSLVVAGTHGKTTTTSMLAWIYQVAVADPRRKPHPGTVVPHRRRRRELRLQLPAPPHAHLHPRGRRVRHRLLRQGPQVPPLLSRRAHPHPRRVRPRRHLRRPRRRQDRLQAPRQSGPAPRPHRRLRRQRQRHRVRQPTPSAASIATASREAADWRIRNLRHEDGLHPLGSSGAPAPLWAELEMQLAGEHNALNATAAAALAASQGIPTPTIANPLSPPSRASSAASKSAPSSTASPSSTTSPTTPRPSAKPSAPSAPSIRSRASGPSSSRAPTRCAARCSQADLVESLRLADRIVLAGVYQQQRIPDAERLHPEDVVARPPSAAARKPNSTPMPTPSSTPSPPTRPRRRRRHPFQWRLRRHL